MTRPKNDLTDLQVIQFEIAKYIDKYRAETDAENVVAELKKAVTYLNNAKLAIMDREEAAGTLKDVTHEEVETKK